MDLTAFRQRIISTPKWFHREALGANPWDRQSEITKAIFAHRRVSARGCVASGKTHGAALAIFSWLFALPQARAFTIAPSYRQVDNNLWGELRRIHAKAPAPLGGRMYETTEYKLGPDWYALGFSTKEPSMVHGIHGPNDLLVIDDAHGVPKLIFDEVENMMAGGNTHVLLLFNPIMLSGETYECTHSKRNLYHNIKIGFADTPNAKGPVVVPGMLTKAQADEWAKTYGKDSSFYQVKVNGEYPSQESDTLLPLTWIEAAVERGRALDYEAVIADQSLVIRTLGVDCARFGSDSSCIAPMVGKHVLPIDVYQGMRTTEVAGRAITKQRELVLPATAFVDVIGIGAGVVDTLYEKNALVAEVNVSEESDTGDDKYANLRSQVWGQLRDALDPDQNINISLPDDPELVGELSSVRYSIDSSGRIAVEPKKDMRKRLGRSPDRGDSVCLANYGRIQAAGEVMALI